MDHAKKGKKGSEPKSVMRVLKASLYMMYNYVYIQHNSNSNSITFCNAIITKKLLPSVMSGECTFIVCRWKKTAFTDDLEGNCFKTGPLQCLRDGPPCLTYLTIIYDTCRSHAYRLASAH